MILFIELIKILPLHCAMEMSMMVDSSNNNNDSSSSQQLAGSGACCFNIYRMFAAVDPKKLAPTVVSCLLFATDIETITYMQYIQAKLSPATS